jgi:hypothetical protein
VSTTQPYDPDEPVFQDFWEKRWAERDADKAAQAAAQVEAPPAS